MPGRIAADVAAGGSPGSGFMQHFRSSFVGAGWRRVPGGSDPPSAQGERSAPRPGPMSATGCVRECSLHTTGSETHAPGPAA